MAKETVIVGCRLPVGLKLTLREPSKVKGQPGKIISSVEINGMNRSKILGATYTTTIVDAEFWETWKKQHADYAPLENGAIFQASSEEQAKFKAKELVKVPTGFEALNPVAMGVKPAKD